MMEKIINKPAETVRDDNIGEKLTASTSEDAMMECRSCLAGLQEDACVDVFCPWNPPWPGMGLSMAEDLAKLAGIQICVSDPYSKMICKNCCIKLQDAINFMVIVQKSDVLLRKRLKHSFTEASSWPKPIQIDKNISKDALQDMEIEIENIKQEVASDDEFDNNVACNDTTDGRLETLDIKIEPEEMTQQHISIDIDNSITQLEEKQTSTPNGDAEIHGRSEELLQDMKEEPLTDEDLDAAPDIEKDCMLCTKAFHTVRGLKAHVIAVHSYDTVRTPPKPPCLPEKTHKCAVCNNYFETQTDLLVHETCHGKFTCYVCEKKFNNFQQLRKHRTKQCKKRSVLPRLKTLDDVRRLPPAPEIKKFKSSHLKNVLQYNINNIQGRTAPELSSDINIPENIKTLHVINRIEMKSQIGNTVTDKSNIEAEDHPEVPCLLENLPSGIDLEISNKDNRIENNHELEDNNSVRQIIETGMPCIEMEKDICHSDQNNCNDDEVTNEKTSEMEKEKDIGHNDENNYKNNVVSSNNTSETEKDTDIGRNDENIYKDNVLINDNTSEMEIDKVICLNDENTGKDDELINNNSNEMEIPKYIFLNDEIDCKDNEITNNNSEVTCINVCSKEGSGFNMLEESNIENVKLLTAITSETSSNDTLESEINITEKVTQTHKLDDETTVLEQIATKEKTAQNDIKLLNSNCFSGESMEIQLGANSLEKGQNDMETDIDMKSLEQD